MNKANKVSTKKGIVGIIVLLVIALLVLSYFGFNLRQTIQAPTTQDNFHYVWGNITYFWNTYLKEPATYFYNLYVELVWNPGLVHLRAITNHQGNGLGIPAEKIVPLPSVN